MIRARVKSFRHYGAAHDFFTDISLTFPTGSISCLLGLSGCGKTTLLKLILGLQPGTFHGTIDFQVDDTATDARSAKENGMIGLLTDHAPLIPWLTLEDNLQLPSRLNPRVRTPSYETIHETLAALNLRPDDLLKYPHQLSVGMKYRASLVRLLAYVPKILFLDELFSGLDPVNCADVSNALREHVNRHNTTCLIITHDVERAVQLGSTFYYLTRHQRLQALPAATTADELYIIMRRDRDDRHSEIQPTGEAQ